MSDSLHVHKVGEVRITLIREMEADAIPAEALIPEWNPAEVETHKEGLVPVCMDESTRQLGLSNHSWLVQTPLHTALIDTGVGNGKKRSDPMFNNLNTPFLKRLEAHGIAPENVDYVLLTHLHVDHVGWNTRWDGGDFIPTFPNARYFMSRREKEHYAALLGSVGAEASVTAQYVDSIIPILGQADFIGIDGGELFDGLSYFPTPGHSIDHMSIKLHSASEDAIFAGDVFHHPMQIFKPEWSSVYSENKSLGEKSRQMVLEYAASSGALVFTTHCPGSSAGYITREGRGFSWTFA